MKCASASALGVGGDLITAIDGKPVTEPDAVTRAIGRSAPATCWMSRFPERKTLNLKIKLGEAPDDQN